MKRTSITRLKHDLIIFWEFLNVRVSWNEKNLDYEIETLQVLCLLLLRVLSLKWKEPRLRDWNLSVMTNKNFEHYLNGFSQDVRDIIENFNLDGFIERLDRNNRLSKPAGNTTRRGMSCGYWSRYCLRNTAALTEGDCRGNAGSWTEKWRLVEWGFGVMKSSV